MTPFYNKFITVSAHFFRSKYLTKLNAPNDLLYKRQDVLDHFDNGINQRIFRYASPLFTWLIMLKTQNSYFVKKHSIL